MVAQRILGQADAIALAIAAAGQAGLPPKEAAAIVARQYNADPGQIESAILALVRINYWSRGEFNYEAMDRLVAGMRIVGDLHGKVDWTALVDASFLPAATETK